VVNALKFATMQQVMQI